MTSFFKRLFQGSAATAEPDRVADSPLPSNSVDRYFALHDQILQAKSAKQYARVAALAKATTPLFAQVVTSERRKYGSWDIAQSVAVRDGAPVLMALGDHAGLREMQQALSSVRELEGWAADVSARAELALVGDRLVALIQAQRSVAQKDAKSLLGVADGREFANLCSWLEKVGRIRREKVGSSYRLLAGPPN